MYSIDEYRTPDRIHEVHPLAGTEFGRDRIIRDVEVTEGADAFFRQMRQKARDLATRGLRLWSRQIHTSEVQQPPQQASGE